MTGGFFVHIVDDDAAVRESLRFVLEAAGWPVRDYDAAPALLDRVGELEPGIIVTDVRMPGMSGLELVGALKLAGANHPIIVLTGHADVAMAVDAMKEGVVDFIEKPFGDDALLNAIAAAGQRLQGGAARLAERAEAAKRFALLTPRERDVFSAVASGDSNKVAAQKLGISPRTVEIYRAHVMEKLKARSLSDLVRLALLFSSEI
jgi:two-component system response regulator FixJ